MPLHDDDHRVARRLKDIERRLSNVEQRSQSNSNPNILVTVEDSVGATDSVDSVEVMSLETGAWGNTGWGTSTWSSNDS